MPVPVRQMASTHKRGHVCNRQLAFVACNTNSHLLEPLTNTVQIKHATETHG